MADPQGGLTRSQLEIMDIIWKVGSAGASVNEICEALGRDLARTTVLTQVSRLEKRKWLKRLGSGRRIRFCALRGKRVAIRNEAVDFVDEYFGGSTSELVMSLLGSRKIKPDEVNRLKKILDDHEGNKGDDNA